MFLTSDMGVELGHVFLLTVFVITLAYCQGSLLAWDDAFFSYICLKAGVSGLAPWIWHLLRTDFISELLVLAFTFRKPYHVALKLRVLMWFQLTFFFFFLSSWKVGFWSPSLFSVSPEMYLSEVLYLGCSCFVIGATCSLKFATLTESMRMCLLRYLVI